MLDYLLVGRRCRRGILSGRPAGLSARDFGCGFALTRRTGILGRNARDAGRGTAQTVRQDHCMLRRLRGQCHLRQPDACVAHVEFRGSGGLGIVTSPKRNLPSPPPSSRRVSLFTFPKPILLRCTHYYCCVDHGSILRPYESRLRLRWPVSAAHLSLACGGRLAGCQ